MNLFIAKKDFSFFITKKLISIKVFLGFVSCPKFLLYLKVDNHAIVELGCGRLIACHYCLVSFVVEMRSVAFNHLFEWLFAHPPRSQQISSS